MDDIEIACVHNISTFPLIYELANQAELNCAIGLIEPTGIPYDTTEPSSLYTTVDNFSHLLLILQTRITRTLPMFSLLTLVCSASTADKWFKGLLSSTRVHGAVLNQMVNTGLMDLFHVSVVTSLDSDATALGNHLLHEDHISGLTANHTGQMYARSRRTSRMCYEAGGTDISITRGNGHWRLNRALRSSMESGQPLSFYG